jgi:hypothetical protein
MFLSIANKEQKAKQQKEKRFKRILEEFPWLWAVKSSWFPGYGSIEIHRANPFFLLQKPLEPRQVWIKVSMLEIQRVNYIVQQTDQTLALTACCAIVPGEIIECIVVAVSKDSISGRGKDFVILREPSHSESHGQSFHKFCFQLAFPNLEI